MLGIGFEKPEVKLTLNLKNWWRKGVDLGIKWMISGAFSAPLSPELAGPARGNDSRHTRESTSSDGTIMDVVTATVEEIGN